MAVTYGFYNAALVNNQPDRVYNAEQVSSIFDGVITDGVYSTIGNKLMVTASSGLQINVGAGRAWFKHTWTLNDAILPLTLDSAEAVLNRIDTVVLEVNRSNAVRANEIKIVKGTPSSTPVAPTLINNHEQGQYPLADIFVQAGNNEITQSAITNRVGTTDTPFVTGILQQVTTDALLTQWQAQFNEWNTEQQEAFQAWFDDLQIILDGDVATHLANQIEIAQETISLYESMGWTDPGVNATNS